MRKFIKRFLGLSLLISMVILILCSCSNESFKTEQPYDSPHPTMSTLPEPSMTPSPVPTPIATDTPITEPLLIVSEKEVNEYISGLSMDSPPERIEVIYDGLAVLILYSQKDVYTLYELHKNPEGKLISLKKDCSGYSCPKYRIIIKNTVNELNLPYAVLKIYDSGIYENSVKTIIHGFEESMEFDCKGEQLLICADQRLDAVNHVESFNAGGEKIGECYFNRSVIIQPDVVPPQDSIVFGSGTIVYAWGGGTSSLRYDLDGDGTIDEIDFAFPGFSDNSHKILNTDDIYKALEELSSLSKDTVSIRINGEEFSFRGAFLQGLVMVVDIDSTDGRYELLIGEEGPSNDYFSTFIGYDGQQPYIMGITGGTPDYSTLVDGRGYITTDNRGRLLHTWFYDAEYVIEDGYLVEHIENGLINMNYKVTLKVDLPLQLSREDYAISHTIAAGQNATLTWTDDEKWCCIETADGKEGWFEVESYQLVKVLGMWSGDVFDGLCMAD